MRIAKVDVAPDDRPSLVGAAVLDADHVPEAQVLRTQFKAQRSLRGLAGIASAADEGKARAGRAGSLQFRVCEKPAGGGEQCQPK
jgi:hypothetical protein